MNWSDEIKNEILLKIQKYLEAHGNSECIAQGSDSQWAAVELMCDIADLVDPII